MNASRGILISLFCLLVALPPAAAGEFYADAMKGDDDDAGTLEQPWKTLNAWFVDSLVKVFRDTPPAAAAAATPEYVAARNGHVSVQLAVRSRRALSDFAVRVDGPKGRAGDLGKSVKIEEVGYIVVAGKSAEMPSTPTNELIGEPPGWYPDRLLSVSKSIPARQTTPFWVTIHVPAGATPGVYEGAIILSSGGRDLLTRPFRLRVYGASVPAARTLKVTNWFRLDDRSSQQFYGCDRFSPEWWRMVENIARVMADYRQNVIMTSHKELVRPYVADGQLRYDFTHFDKWVETFERAGALEIIEGGHLLGRAGGYYEPLQATVMVLEGGKPVTIKLPPDDPRVEPAVVSFLKALNEHLETKQLKKKYIQHVLDEPHGDEPVQYGRFAGLVRRHLPGVPIIDAIDAAHIPEEVETYCDIWVPLLGKFDGALDALKRRQASGREVWYYVCLIPQGAYMNRLVDFPLIKTRLLHWVNYRYDLAGFLHWGWNWWTPDPIYNTQPVINQNQTWLPSGDAFIVYPDKENLTVRSSLRLEAMREGIEDYELLRALGRKDKVAADRIAGEMVRTTTDYVRDPAQFRKLHRQLLESLSD